MHSNFSVFSFPSFLSMELYVQELLLRLVILHHCAKVAVQYHGTAISERIEPKECRI